MRYLSYTYVSGEGSDRSIQLTLNHPELLVSLSTRLVKVINFGDLKRLKNVCSVENSYKSKDFNFLMKLEKIVSSNDEYGENGQSLL